MSIKIAKLRFFALMFRLFELETEKRAKTDVNYYRTRVYHEPEPFIFTNPHRKKFSPFYDHEASKFISNPKHNFKRR